MKNYFFKINKTYLEGFTRKVLNQFKNVPIHSDAFFLKSLFKEINELFKFLGGMISSKEDIPKSNEYPDSSKFNRLLYNINTDLNKLFSSQKIIEGDINNLLNFNSSHRVKTFENLTSTQQKIYSLYIKNRGIIGGEIIIPSANPFSSSDNLNLNESTGVKINQDRGTLTLDYQSEQIKPIDINHVQIYFSKIIPKDQIYPNISQLGLGSHWKKDYNDNHFISDYEEYRTRMIDGSNLNNGIGWVEFEAVRTMLSYTILGVTPDESRSRLYEGKLKDYISQKYNRDIKSIYLDSVNSLQGEYITSTPVEKNEINPQYKLVIPFNNVNIAPTNEISIDFEPDAMGVYPRVIWSESKVYSNQKGSDIEYSIIAPSNYNPITNNGIYRIIIKDAYIIPTRIEIILEYDIDDNHWVPIDFIMSHYSFNAKNNYHLESFDPSQPISLILEKTYDVYVDKEIDEENEKRRVINIMKGRV